uniref:lysozyme n=1 Tax=Anopheles dirus TaxID=7168 RepID=A0A182NIB8_9DIPT
MVRFGVIVLVVIVNSAAGQTVHRSWTRCEVARELSLKHVPEDQIGDWLCIAERGASYNGSAVNLRFKRFGGSGYYGLFQIIDRYACARYGSICGLATCDSLLDDDLDDDIECMLKIHAAYVRELGDGFAAWPIHKTASCRGDEERAGVPFDDCLDEEVVRVQAYFKRKRAKAKKANLVQAPAAGKVYERCELAQELRDRHRMPLEQIATWVCIAYHESRLNTSAEGRLNADGSGDHGLFQISDIYWCSPDAARPGKACRVTCEAMRDNDIADDVRCVRMIFDEHRRISGNGFHAWTVYKPYCEGREASFVHNCFEQGQTERYPTTANKPRPGVVVPTAAPAKNSARTNIGKVYDRCELANDLLHKFHMPKEQVATWVCIAYHESRFNTSAEGRLNADGSGDHGLFQISDIYWCSPPGNGWACGVSCEALKDSDITDDVRCARTIYDEHQRLSGDGFNAWSVYKPYCAGRSEEFVRRCFGDDDDQLPHPVTVPRPAITAPTTIAPHRQRSSPAKVFERCELARELHLRQGLPLDQTASWVCIAKYQSNFNTSAIGYGPEGVHYHGMFQLSDEFWCSPPGRGWVCGITCEQLRDGDITDDLACMRHIYEEHQRISGDGYNAWAVYQPYCRGKSATLLDGCFEEGENAIVPTPPTTRRPVSPPKNFARGKVYERCELARELYYRHRLPFDQIATWVCIAHRESSYNVSAIGRLNADGSEDHGLFQISDIYWCSPPGKGWVCGLSCSDLEDNDLTDDVECMRTIHEEHTRLSGDGFNAWAVYRPYCKGRSEHYVSGCFEDSDIDTITDRAPITTTTTTTPSSSSRRPTTTTRSRTSTTKFARWSTSPTARSPTPAAAKLTSQRQTAVRTSTPTVASPTSSTTASSTTRSTTSLYEFYLNNFGRRPAVTTAMPVYTFKPFASRQRATATSTATESATSTLPPVTTTARFSDFNRWFQDG